VNASGSDLIFYAPENTEDTQLPVLLTALLALFRFAIVSIITFWAIITDVVDNTIKLMIIGAWMMSVFALLRSLKLEETIVLYYRCRQCGKDFKVKYTYSEVYSEEPGGAKCRKSPLDQARQYARETHVHQKPQTARALPGHNPRR
jgi:hypothetical protein